MATQVINTQFLNTPIVDGPLLDKNRNAVGLDGKYQDLQIINTQMYDKPIAVASQTNPVIVPIG